MPIYEYKCDSCGSKFEKLVRRSEDRIEVACPSCGDRHLSQEYSTFAAHAHSAAGTSPAGKSPDLPMCPSGGPCRNPGMCGMN